NVITHASTLYFVRSIQQTFEMSMNFIILHATLMRKTLLILFAVCFAAWLATDKVSAQSYNRVSEKNIKVVRGKMLVLTGAVRDGDEVLYRFRARAGQRVTVKVIGRDADFTVYLNYGLDVEPVA